MAETVLQPGRMVLVIASQESCAQRTVAPSPISIEDLSKGPQSKLEMLLGRL